MAIKIIQAVEQSSNDYISFRLTDNNSIRIDNDHIDPSEAVYMEIDIDDWIQIAKFISEEIAKVKPND